MISVLGLNVAAPTPERARELLAYLWSREEQVLVLTEVTGSPGSQLLLQVCRAAGYAVLAPSLTSRDRGAVVVVRDRAIEIGEPRFAEGSRIVRIDVGGVVLLGVYGAASDPVRYASATQRERKREWLARFDQRVAAEVAGRTADEVGRGAGGAVGDKTCPLLIVGDLNIVDPDDADGLPYVLTQERESYRRLLDLGFVDAIRAGIGGTAPTWVDHSGVGCRYDHAFALGLDVLSAEIDDQPRLNGLTDHSAIAVDVAARE